MYLITDSYGTKQRCWTRAKALSWLSACSPEAQVKDIFGRIVATRVQSKRVVHSKIKSKIDWSKY